ncbi:hypothetical protein [Streptomyces atratus]
MDELRIDPAVRSASPQPPSRYENPLLRPSPRRAGRRAAAPRAMWVQAMSRAVRKQETGTGITPEEDELLKAGIPGAAHVLVKPY